MAMDMTERFMFMMKTPLFVTSMARRPARLTRGVRRAGANQFIRSSPRVLLGYFARWAATRKLLYQFRDVENNTDGDALITKQILSLGAGFDPTYF
ncbi:hypothetical protein JHK86_043346 [Glycine max]|nr:hypothetical protein JHK86_043346 [Glycine max]